MKIMARSAFLVSLLLAAPAHAGFEDGLRAYEGLDPDYVTAFKEMKSGAEAGDPRAYYYLGMMYRHGKGVAWDRIKARKWFWKSVEERGSVNAWIELGKLDPDFKGSNASLTYSKQMVARLKQSAEEGNADGLRAYEGPQRDYVTAFKEMKSAAEAGDPRAYYYLGMMYRHGKGIAWDRLEARNWFWKSVEERGSVNAWIEIGRLDPDFEGSNASLTYSKQMIARLKKSAKEGKAGSQYILGQEIFSRRVTRFGPNRVPVKTGAVRDYETQLAAKKILYYLTSSIFDSSGYIGEWRKKRSPLSDEPLLADLDTFNGDENWLQITEMGAQWVRKAADQQLGPALVFLARYSAEVDAKTQRPPFIMFSPPVYWTDSSLELLERAVTAGEGYAEILLGEALLQRKKIDEGLRLVKSGISKGFVPDYLRSFPTLNWPLPSPATKQQRDEAQKDKAFRDKLEEAYQEIERKERYYNRLFIETMIEHSKAGNDSIQYVLRRHLTNNYKSVKPFVDLDEFKKWRPFPPDHPASFPKYSLTREIRKPTDNDLAYYGKYKLAKNLARVGSVGARWSLGEFHRLADNPGRRDLGEAVHWYRMAAELGYAPAQYVLSRLYDIGGEGLAPDPAEAKKWRDRIVGRGDAAGLYHLGKFFFDFPQYETANLELLANDPLFQTQTFPDSKPRMVGYAHYYLAHALGYPGAWPPPEYTERASDPRFTKWTFLPSMTEADKNAAIAYAHELWLKRTGEALVTGHPSGGRAQ